MSTLNRRIAPLALWLCFLALSFCTTINGQSQSARMPSRDRQEQAKPLRQEAPRGARVVREGISIAAAGLLRGQEVEGRFR
jgi:hypothetical protein